LRRAGAEDALVGETPAPRASNFGCDPCPSGVLTNRACEWSVPSSLCISKKWDAIKNRLGTQTLAVGNYHLKLS
jgi:hypothetical protein